MAKKKLPKYLIVYRCESCSQDSGYTDRDKPHCRYCGRTDQLVIISKQEITPEVMAARLKAVTDNMMENLTKAYEQLPKSNETIVSEGKDAEVELLRLMHLAKRLRDKVHGMDFFKKKDEE